MKNQSKEIFDSPRSLITLFRNKYPERSFEKVAAVEIAISRFKKSNLTSTDVDNVIFSHSIGTQVEDNAFHFAPSKLSGHLASTAECCAILRERAGRSKEHHKALYLSVDTQVLAADYRKGLFPATKVPACL